MSSCRRFGRRFGNDVPDTAMELGSTAAGPSQGLADVDLAEALAKLHRGIDQSSLEAVMVACIKAKANLERRDQVSFRQLGHFQLFLFTPK